MARKSRNGSIMAVMAAPALLATIAASYTAFWFYNADSLKTALSEFAIAQKHDGNTLRYAIDSTDGFPWGIKVTLKAVDYSYNDDDTRWSLSAPELVLSSGVFSPRTATVDFPADTRLSQTRDRVTSAVTKTSGLASLTVTTDSENTVRQANITLENLQANGSWNGRSMATPLKVEHGIANLTINPNADQEDTKTPYASLSVVLNKWQWPSNVRYKLGANLDKFDLSAKVFGVIDRKQDLQQALTLWREDGGQVSVGRIAMTWGPSKLGGYGTMVLDDNLQPAANVTTQVKGFTNIVNQLDQLKLIRPKDATMARVVIGQQLPRNGSGNLSLSLRNGVVYVGPLALTRVPLIDWPNDTTEEQDTGPKLLQPGFDIGPDGSITRKGQ